MGKKTCQVNYAVCQCRMQFEESTLETQQLIKFGGEEVVSCV